MRLVFSVLAILGFASCQCGASAVAAKGDPNRNRNLVDTDVPDYWTGEPDGGLTESDGAGDAGFPACPSGVVTGRVCATDRLTWLNGAAVSITGTDCNGQPFTTSTTSANDGSFTLTAPEGPWTVHAELGSFTQDLSVVVRAGQATNVPDNQLCIAQHATRIAVITGSGDHIEQLLSGLNLQYDTFDGAGGWNTSAGALLTDLPRLATYDLVFFDCAAAKQSGAAVIDLGPSSTTIARNLHDYVAGGGSIYASDWALVFPVLAFPGVFTFALNTAGAVQSPFNTHELMGYAPQTITSSISNAPLSTFIGKSAMEVSFPMQTGALSLHWGLLSQVDSQTEVLMTAPQASACWTTSLTCSNPGAAHASVPIAVRYKATPAGQKGGWVLYTAFHNIAQPTNDVSQVLKYLVLNL